MGSSPGRISDNLPMGQWKVSDNVHVIKLLHEKVMYSHANFKDCSIVTLAFNFLYWMNRT